MSNLLPAKIGDLVIVQPQAGDYERTVVVECIHEDGRIGVFMPCFGGGAYRRPSLCYWNDEQYVVLASGWKGDLEKARREKAEADEAARIKPGDFVRITNRERQYDGSGFFPGSTYRVVEILERGVIVRIEDLPLYFRDSEFEKVLEKDRFNDED